MTAHTSKAKHFGSLKHPFFLLYSSNVKHFVHLVWLFRCVRNVRGNAPKVNSGCLIELSRFKVRWDRPGGEAAFRHLHYNDLIKQDRRKNADRKK